MKVKEKYIGAAPVYFYQCEFCQYELPGDRHTHAEDRATFLADTSLTWACFACGEASHDAPQLLAEEGKIEVSWELPTLAVSAVIVMFVLRAMGGG